MLLQAYPKLDLLSEFRQLFPRIFVDTSAKLEEAIPAHQG